MTPEPMNSTPQAGPRSARLRILAPIALSVAALVVFLALFWNGTGHGKKHARRTQTASERGRSPVGGQEGLEDLGNDRVTGKGNGSSPVGGGSARSGGSGKGEAWWDPKGKPANKDEGDRWWAPEGKAQAGSESPVGGAPEPKHEAQGSAGEKPRAADKQARPSAKNPGETAGAKGGPDDFWWRK